MLPAMARSSHWSREGARRASRLTDRFGSELRIARVTAGLSQAQLAGLVGVDQSFVSRVEHGLRTPTWTVACALAAAVGHDVSVRLFPTATIGLQDSGQLAIAREIIDQAHASLHPTIEAPISASGHDRRAADVVLVGRREALHIEIERRLVDLQAQLRAAQLKRAALAERLTLPVRLVIAVPDTRRVREVVASQTVVLRAALPASSSAAWKAIRNGTVLGSDGLIFVRTQHMTPES
jgi:transcriptional regulator with XRE-family HTH domain